MIIQLISDHSYHTNEATWTVITCQFVNFFTYKHSLCFQNRFFSLTKFWNTEGLLPSPIFVQNFNHGIVKIYNWRTTVLWNNINRVEFFSGISGAWIYIKTPLSWTMVIWRKILILVFYKMSILDKLMY